MISTKKREELRESCDHAREVSSVTRMEMPLVTVLALLDALDEADRDYQDMRRFQSKFIEADQARREAERKLAEAQLDYAGNPPVTAAKG